MGSNWSASALRGLGVLLEFRPLRVEEEPAQAAREEHPREHNTRGDGQDTGLPGGSLAGVGVVSEIGAIGSHGRSGG